MEYPAAILGEMFSFRPLGPFESGRERRLIARRFVFDAHRARNPSAESMGESQITHFAIFRLRLKVSFSMGMAVKTHKTLKTQFYFLICSKPALDWASGCVLDFLSREIQRFQYLERNIERRALDMFLKYLVKNLFPRHSLGMRPKRLKYPLRIRIGKSIAK
jgi:hypothetical protein